MSTRISNKHQQCNNEQYSLDAKISLDASLGKNIFVYFHTFCMCHSYIYNLCIFPRKLITWVVDTSPQHVLTTVFKNTTLMSN